MNCPGAVWWRGTNGLVPDPRDATPINLSSQSPHRVSLAQACAATLGTAPLALTGGHLGLNWNPLLFDSRWLILTLI